MKKSTLAISLMCLIFTGCTAVEESECVTFDNQTCNTSTKSCRAKNDPSSTRQEMMNCPTPKDKTKCAVTKDKTKCAVTKDKTKCAVTDKKENCVVAKDKTKCAVTDKKENCPPTALTESSDAAEEAVVTVEEIVVTPIVENNTL